MIKSQIKKRISKTKSTFNKNLLKTVKIKRMT
jgi:hypothetical protein